MEDRALNYARRGFPVMPCNGKLPYTQNGLLDATIEANRVTDYWTRYPTANIGIAIPPGYFVLDVDIRHEGFESLQKLQEKYEELPQTLHITTGSGGAHYWYTTKETIRNTTKLSGYKGLDIRGVGGYVIVPPSIHESGNKYERSPHSAKQITESPEWLEQLCLSKAKSAPQTANESLTEGTRNDTLTRDAGSMRRRGLSEQAILAALLVTNQEKCDPPLEGDEVRMIAKSINRYPPEEHQPSTKGGYTIEE